MHIFTKLTNFLVIINSYFRSQSNIQLLTAYFRKMIRVATVEACRFMVDCLHAAGANREAAEQQAKLLIQADKCGHPSHGMNRLGKLLKQKIHRLRVLI